MKNRGDTNATEPERLNDATTQPQSYTEIVVDTTVIVAVVTNEPIKERLIEATLDVTLVAPSSIDVEVGNAFSRMFKRQRIDLATAELALESYSQIPITSLDVDLLSAVRLAHELDIYAYDAYVIDCALKNDLPIISLDGGLLEASRRANVETIEVEE